MPLDRNALFQSALKQAQAERTQELQAQSAKGAEGGNVLTGVMDAVNSAGLGILKAGIETKETAFGLMGQPEPNYEDKWRAQRAIEADAAELDRRSGVNAFVGDVSQFVTGMVGLGKFKALGMAGEIVKGAVIGATVFDPQEARMSDLIESYPELHNPITDFLASDVNDSDAEGRLKNALEGIGMDIALAPVFAASVKVFKAVKGGDPVAIATAQKELDAAQAGHMGDDQGLTTPEGITPAQGGATTNQGSFEDAYSQVADAQGKGSVEEPPVAPQSEISPRPDVPSTQATDRPATGGGSPAAMGGEAPVGEVGEGVPAGVSQADGRVGPTGRLAEDAGLERGPTDTISQRLDETDGSVDGAGRPSSSVPGPKVTINPEDEALDRLVQGFEADMGAIQKFGTREAAEASGHVFGASGSLPWQKLNDGGDEGLKTFTDQVAHVFKQQFDEAKGGAVLTDARLDHLVAQRVALYGDDPATVMGMIQQAGAGANALAANMEAGFLVANKAFADTYKLVQQIRLGSLADFKGDAGMAEKALRHRLQVALEATAASRAMVAASGRTLRRMGGKFGITPEQLKALTTMDTDQLIETIYNSQGNPKKLADMATPGFADRLVRGAGGMMANNLLWGWPTHVVNVATSAFMTVVRPAEKIVGSFLTPNGSAIRTAALRDYRYMAASIGDAWETAISAFVKGDSVMAPHQTEWFKAGFGDEVGKPLSNAAKMGFVPNNTVKDLFKNSFTAFDFALHLPTRALGMVDEFIKQMSYRGHIQSRASVKADELGLTGQDAIAYIQKALDDAFDANYQALDKDALYEAQVRTFSQPLTSKTLGSTLQNAVAVHPALRAIFPFVRTPINVFRYAWKQTPLINLAQKEYREMISGKMGEELQASAIGQMAVGSLALAMGSMLTSGGHLTGGGPKEPNLRKAMEATGWRAYSFVKDNGDGTHTYIPYNRFDPTGLLFGISADLTEMMVTYPERTEEGENIAVGMALAVAKNMSDKTYLQNINGFMKAATDPGANMGKFAGQLGEGLIPFSSMLRQMNPDPYMREARSALDNMLDRMPGYSQNLPPQRDPFGYPIRIKSGLAFQDSADDLVDAEQQRMILETGRGITNPLSYSREGVDLRDLPVPRKDGTMTTAWDRLQEIAIQPEEAGSPLKEAIGKEILSDTYKMAPDGTSDTKGTKSFFLARIMTKYREAAYKQLLREYPEEVGKPLGRRKMEAREAWRVVSEKKEAGEGQINQLREFANSYGVDILGKQ